MFSSSAVNQYFDQVYVLNLEKRIDRRHEMLQKLSRLNIKAEFVTAVNGYDFQNGLEYETYLQQPIGVGEKRELRLGRKLIGNAGAWGCLKSYNLILEDARSKAYQRILCLEDDAVFHRDFENKFRKAIEKIPDKWKLLYLGASQRIWESPEGLTYPNQNAATPNPDAPYYFAKKTFGTFAFGIHHSVFDLMLGEVRKMSSPIDDRPVQVVTETYPESCLVLIPNLVIADVTDSDIMGKRSQSDLAEKVRWNLEDYDFPFQIDENFKLDPVQQNFFTMAHLNYRHHRNILVEKNKTVFFIIPKTGCSSLKAQLVEPLNLEKKENIAALIHDPRHYPFPFAEYDALNSTYADYFKFAIVRNPWDRMVSCFKDKIRAADYNESGFKNGVAIPLQGFGKSFYGGMTFRAFVEQVCALSDAVADNHFRSQFFQLINAEGELLVNYIGRFETMEQSLAEISQLSGLPFTSSVHLNKTKTGKSFREYYDEELIEKVRHRYFADVRLLEYQFDSDETPAIGRIDAKWKEHFSQPNIFAYHLQEKNKYLNLELKNIQQKLSGEGSNERLKQDLENLQRQLEAKEKQIKALQQSLSWKITAPFRKLLAGFKAKGSDQLPSKNDQ